MQSSSPSGSHSGSHLRVVTTESQEHQPPAVQIKDINIIINQLTQVEADIKTLLD
jgi:hypothetical protein